MSLSELTHNPGPLNQNYIAPQPPQNHQIIARPDPIIKADAMAFVRFARKEPDLMERFLADFGLVRCAVQTGTRFYRGAGGAAYLVAVEEGEEDAFLGFGVTVAQSDDLDRLAAATGATVTELDTPGGGRGLRLTDPDGLAVDVVHGVVEVEPLDRPEDAPLVNTPFSKVRVNQGVRRALRPSPIFRLGHVLMQRPDFDRAIQWYMRHVGIIPTDVQLLEDGSPALAFCRLDRGSEPADHHSIGILGGLAAGLLHVSFETLDIDSVGQGHQYLKARGWSHFWGMGRHNFGSQVFDYWKDPAGDEWEHYADGDVMDASHPTGYYGLGRGTLWQWGDDLPLSMRPDLPLEALPDLHAQGAFGDLPLERVRAFFEAMQKPARPWMR
ncbi:VOC family protein [Sphingobium sp. EM0848]|uniref:VOC family protein n=1 Tax=Sphingobium sp. EM0848 TaxID=2743473 RepID=UPI00159C45EB|nr:VOC family protein [Sphingobium sp. EM0848]